MLSVTEDHEYNEMVDEAIVSASKSSAVADEVLRDVADLHKRLLKKWDYHHLLFFKILL
jgi:ATP-dependent DNA helicase RecQ